MTPCFRCDSPEYSLDDWKAVIDDLADDYNSIYFRTGGLFRSLKYPESLADPMSGLSDDDLRALIDHCHSVGIEFCLGYGVFGSGAMERIAEAHPDTKASDVPGMCPSNAVARRINSEYGLEIMMRYPEADGLMLEMRDEYGPCFCETCQQQLDEYGSRQYGQSELGWLREFTEELWTTKPSVQVAVTIGYMERGSHTNDPMYYEGIKAMDEPRLHWLAVRNNYELPGNGGKMFPISYFSAQVMNCMHYYAHSPKQIGDWLAQSHNAGAVGVCPAFEPGFRSYSYHSYDIPFPTDALPYSVSRFAFREFARNPQMSNDGFLKRVGEAFFDPGTDSRFSKNLIHLSEMIQEVCGDRQGQWKPGWFREMVTRAADPSVGEPMTCEAWKTADACMTKFHQLFKKYNTRLKEIEAEMPALEATGERGSIAAMMMRKAITDTRHEMMFDEENWPLLDLALLNAKCNVPDRKSVV
jgi:hypothetical protein